MPDGPRHALFAEFAEVARALGHPHRLEILEHLAQGERAVDALAERTGLTLANASQHLQRLRRAGLVAARRQGRHTRYRLTNDQVLTLLAALRTVAEGNLAQVERIVRDYFTARDRLEPVSHPELLERLRSGTVTVLDVRPADEYAAGHLPRAVNIPLQELEVRLEELDPSREIVAYCRGPYCMLAFEAVAALRSRGFRVRRLQDGFPEWRAAGLPLESARGQ